MIASGGTLTVDINGTTPGAGYDMVAVNGTVDVTGATLAVTHGHTPGDGDGYTLIANDAADAAGGLPDEIVLHTERPVVCVEVVLRERVRLRTELVQGQETVTQQVQREQIVVEETPAPGVSPR